MQTTKHAGDVATEKIKTPGQLLSSKHIPSFLYSTLQLTKSSVHQLIMENPNTKPAQKVNMILPSFLLPLSFFNKILSLLFIYVLKFVKARSQSAPASPSKGVVRCVSPQQALIRSHSWVGMLR